MSLLPPPLPPLKVSNPAAVLNLSKNLSSGGVSGAIGNGCGDLASSRLGSLFDRSRESRLVLSRAASNGLECEPSTEPSAEVPESEPISEFADANEDVDPASDSVGECDSSSPSLPAVGARTCGGAFGCGFASIASLTVIHSAMISGSRWYDRLRFSTITDSIFPPKPVILTTHSPLTCSSVWPSAAWLTVIVPSTTARSVMLFTVWNVCVNGNLPRSASTYVRVSRNSTSLPRSTGRTTLGSLIPGTWRVTTLTLPSGSNSLDKTSVSLVPSFSLWNCLYDGWSLS
mmetsp:Transcript_741/g.3381  ORF Transcript_741/g.3381 Transcript_741/m.3381 type:complete len:287 (-) Transcript_741:265-1125(-)